MIKSILMFLALVSASAAQAQSCEAREYSQYKDDLKSGTGRIMVTFSYCSNKSTSDRVSGKLASACQSEMGKALDALRSTHDPNAVLFAQGGCKGPLPNK